jgi:hypothetical protein
MLGHVEAAREEGNLETSDIRSTTTTHEPRFRKYVIKCQHNFTSGQKKVVGNQDFSRHVFLFSLEDTNRWGLFHGIIVRLVDSPPMLFISRGTSSKRETPSCCHTEALEGDQQDAWSLV